MHITNNEKGSKNFGKGINYGYSKSNHIKRSDIKNTQNLRKQGNGTDNDILVCYQTSSDCRWK